jgi:hypothetical protein
MMIAVDTINGKASVNAMLAIQMSLYSSNKGAVQNIFALKTRFDSATISAAFLSQGIHKQGSRQDEYRILKGLKHSGYHAFIVSSIHSFIQCSPK